MQFAFGLHQPDQFPPRSAIQILQRDAMQVLRNEDRSLQEYEIIKPWLWTMHTEAEVVLDRSLL